MKIVTSEMFLQTGGRFKIVDIADRLTEALQKIISMKVNSMFLFQALRQE